MLNASAPARGLDPFGEVAGGILEIRSRLLEVFCDAARSPKYRNRGETDISDGQFAIRSNVLVQLLDTMLLMIQRSRHRGV